MWLGGVARDVVGGVLWRGFWRFGFDSTHRQPIFKKSMRLRKKNNAIWGLCWYNSFGGPVTMRSPRLRCQARPYRKRCELGESQPSGSGVEQNADFFYRGDFDQKGRPHF